MKKIIHLFVLAVLLIMGGQGFAQNKHEYVDLGLPSGTLWATCNVGANKPEEFGDYFAWGETEPKTIYNWDTYKYFEDDAATASWGSDWYTPTVDQWFELFHNTESNEYDLNGVKGWLFVGKNGATLFFPAAGSRWDDKLEDADSGNYLSSDIFGDDPTGAWSTSLESSWIGYGELSRGQSVRPVRSKK